MEPPMDMHSIHTGPSTIGQPRTRTSKGSGDEVWAYSRDDAHLNQTLSQIVPSGSAPVLPMGCSEGTHNSSENDEIAELPPPPPPPPRPPSRERVTVMSASSGRNSVTSIKSSSSGKSAKSMFSSFTGAGAARATLKSVGTSLFEGKDGRGSANTRSTFRVSPSKTSMSGLGGPASKDAAPRDSCIVRFSRVVVNNKFFTFLTTILTVYALVGDDIRLMSTNKPADVYFDTITMICLVVFTFEIFVSCYGKDDYIWGFFMCLDVVATSTLLMDLSYVSEAIMGDGDDLDKMRSGRTARVGAKAGRVVRVIRLVRILKLYKAIYEQANKAKKRKNHPDGDDDWDDIEVQVVEGANMQGAQESRVGKKLSEMTTRKVIILVLAMLMVLPFLRTNGDDTIPPSASYGADEVHYKWLQLEKQPTDEALRLRYEQAVLKFVYYHNWYTSECTPSGSIATVCPALFYSRVFWVGIVSSRSESDLQIRVNNTQLRLKSVQAWNQQAIVQQDIFNYGSLPDAVLSTVGSEWSNACSVPEDGIFRRGFSVIDTLRGRQTDMQHDVDFAVPCPFTLRNMERALYFPRLQTQANYKEWHFAFYFDRRPFTQAEAMYGVLITSFVCVVLCVASIYFSSDANKLVLRPVEHMVQRVEAIRQNPLIAMKMADEEFRLELKEKARLSGVKQQRDLSGLKANMASHCKCGTAPPQAPMETVVLEKTIIKLGSLLALGFGEAGANIIGHNLEHSASAGINVMIPGTKVDCIIGKVRIQDFSTCTEVLQANVMTFVNQVAEIVHGVVDELWGCANKNNGDTFLVIWRLSGLGVEMTSKYADMSMLAFTKILGSCHSAPVLASYRAHPGLQQRLGTYCRVCLTFGLHAGWAIEGAVGSEFKIDASYLSPNVSIASSVESATSIYKVPILISQAVVELASDEMAEQCRLIDRVIVRGSATPISFYSLDLDYLRLTTDEPRSSSIKWNLRERFKARQYLEAEKNKKVSPEIAVATEFGNAKDIQAMRKRYTVEFFQVFHMGFQNYTHGEWQVARNLFRQAVRVLKHIEDGPSQALLTFMETHDFQAPSGWVGIRDIADNSDIYADS